MQPGEISFNQHGEIVIMRERGDQFTITEELMMVIWEEMEYRKTKERLKASDAVKGDATLLEDIEKLTYYYITERDQLIEDNETTLIRLSITDVDIEYEENMDDEDENEMDGFPQDLIFGTEG